MYFCYVIDDYFNKNYQKIKNMAYKYSHLNNNTLYIEDLIGECYLFCKSRNHKTKKDLETSVAIFFSKQYFKNSTINQMKGKIKTVELKDFNTPTPENETTGICIVQVKEDLPPAYRKLFEIMFEKKKFRLREIMEELNTSKYGADLARKKLYDLLGIEKPNFRKIDKNELYL